MKFVITQEATNDLEDIWVYTLNRWSLQQADRYFNLIIDEIENLTKDPFSGTDVGFVREGYRKSRVKSHFIFYRVNTKEKKIEIIRILHQQMDIDFHLNDK